MAVAYCWITNFSKIDAIRRTIKKGDCVNGKITQPKKFNHTRAKKIAVNENTKSEDRCGGPHREHIYSGFAKHIVVGPIRDRKHKFSWICIFLSHFIPHPCILCRPFKAHDSPAIPIITTGILKLLKFNQWLKAPPSLVVLGPITKIPSIVFFDWFAARDSLKTVI